MAESISSGMGQMDRVYCSAGRGGEDRLLPAVGYTARGERFAQALHCVVDFRGAAAQLEAGTRKPIFCKVRGGVAFWTFVRLENGLAALAEVVELVF
jgi:hypothetical protein